MRIIGSLQKPQYVSFRDNLKQILFSSLVTILSKLKKVVFLCLQNLNSSVKDKSMRVRLGNAIEEYVVFVRAKSVCDEGSLRSLRGTFK